MNKEIIKSLAQAELESFNLSLLEGALDLERALSSLICEIEEDYNELNSHAVKKARFDFFKIEGANLEDYEERIYSLEEDKFFLYGIRHMGGHSDKPFVLLRPNFQISSEAQILNLYKKIEHEFTPFSPLQVCFWSSSKIEGSTIGSTYLVARAKEIKSLPLWPGEETLRLKKITDDSYYSWYENGYRVFHQDRPELEKKVTLNSLESMEDSKEQGLLFEVYLDDIKMGLIAGERSPFLGHEGIYFHEIFIDSKYKGRGLAKAIQRKFIQDNTKDEEFIWGTIDEQNQPSFRTALSNRRVPLRYESFVTV